MLKMLRRAFGANGSPSEAVDQFMQTREGVPLIRLEQVEKVFSSGEVATQALRGIDLEIHRGEFVTVNGPSGCGKSTLLNIVGLLESPTSGRYLLNGNSANTLKPSLLAQIRNRCIGFIFQNFNLIGDLTIFENVETPLTYLQMPSADRRERVYEALRRVSMESFAKRYPSQITGGQQQKVAVARAVVGDPLILLADEPTGNLDSKSGEAVMGMLEELHSKGSTVCLVSHNPDYVKRAQRAICLFDGRIEESVEDAAV